MKVMLRGQKWTGVFHIPGELPASRKSKPGMNPGWPTARLRHLANLAQCEWSPRTKPEFKTRGAADIVDKGGTEDGYTSPNWPANAGKNNAVCAAREQAGR